MTSLRDKTWLWSIAATLGMTATSWAANPYVSQAEAIFNADQQPLIQQIGHNCNCNQCSEGCFLDGNLFGGELGDAWDLSDSLFTDECGNPPCVDLGGWFQFGYHSANDGVFNTYPHNFQLQQGYLYAEKVADGSEGFGWGFRADILYGTDAQNTQSFGNPAGSWDFANGWNNGVYGWAMPQLYAEVAYDKLSVKLGHFYTLLGYQVVPATGNFFYSIPYTFNFSEAFTHTGALATYQASDDVTIYGGWTLGWDSGFDQLNQGNSFLGGASVALTDEVTATYILTAGNLGWIGKGYTHSLVIDYNINEDWEYVFQSDLVGVDDSVNAADGGHYETIGVNQYLFYNINEKLRAGGRVEWWKADGNSLYEMAYGLNIKPMANLLLRPEVRYNWAPGNLPNVVTGLGFPNDVYSDQFIFGMDAILTF